MRRVSSRVVLLLAAPFIGCGDSHSNQPPAIISGPHAGYTFRLPDGRGLVELVNEPEVLDRNSRTPTSVVAYFLESDAKSPISSAPNDVQLQIQRGTGKSEDLPLKADPKAGDPAGAGRFASAPGPYDLAAIRGKLTGTVKGKEFGLELSAGR